MPTRRALALLLLGPAIAIIVAATGCRPGLSSYASSPDDSSRAEEDGAEISQTPLSAEFVAPLEVTVPPVPVDLAAQERARAARRERLRTYLTSAYDRHGHRNQRWDGLARAALTEWAALRVRPSGFEGLEAWSLFQVLQTNQSLPNHEEQYETSSDGQVRAWHAARQAMDAGCDDPLILHMYSRLSFGECAVHFNARVYYWGEAAAGMEKSSYPALLRAETLARAGAFKGAQAYTQTAQLPVAERILHEALALIPAVARETRRDPIEPRAVYHLGRLLVDALRRLPERKQPALEPAFQEVDAALDDPDVNPVDRLLLAANTDIRLACQARGNQPAWDVSADGWTGFDYYLAKAEEALAEAWRLDPDCAEVPRLMLCVETGQDKGRARLETWFERAMRLNGDDYYACLAKLEYLAPYWHGSEAEMVSFGHACLQTANWDGRLPFILVEAHRILDKISLCHVPAVPPEESYFSRPYVWKDIQAVYEPYLAQHRDARYEQSCYAKLAVLGGHYSDANRLFEELGDSWWRYVFRGRDYENMRNCARTGDWHYLRQKTANNAGVRNSRGQNSQR
jgi:hypothetical protein